MKTDIKFGSYNKSTGESKQGYIENGEMKYKPYPWYNRLYYKLFPYNPPEIKHENTVYIGTTELYSKMIWSNQKNYFDVAVYRTYNTITDKTIEIYADIPSRGRRYYFNVDAYDADKTLI